MRVLTFFGQIENGKSEVAKIITPLLGWKRNSFAGKLKQAAADILDFDLAFLESWKRHPEPPPGMLLPVRSFYQELGALARKYILDIWVQKALALKQDQVIEDGRHFNEMDFLVERGHCNVLVWRPGKENTVPHASESEVAIVRQEILSQMAIPITGPVKHPRMHYLLVNSGDVADLHQQITSLLLPFVSRFFA